MRERVVFHRNNFSMHPFGAWLLSKSTLLNTTQLVTL
jgi:hypothetical protein